MIAINMLLPNKLKEIRLQSNMPQRKIAAELDIDTATYCKYENGTMRMSINQLEKIIKCLNANHDELLTLWQADQFKSVISTDYNIAYDAIRITCDQYEQQKTNVKEK